MSGVDESSPPRGRTEPGGTSAGTRAFRGGVWQALAQVAPYAYTVIVSVVAARILGPERMGRQSFIAFAVTTAQSVTAGGFGMSLLRYVGELRGQRRERALPSLVGWAWQISAAAGALGALPLLAVALAGAKPTWAWVFGAAAVVAGALHRAQGTVLIGTERWRSHAVILLVTGAASVVATLAVLLLGGGISGMLAVIAATAAAMLVWTTVVVQRVLAPLQREREPLGEIRRELVKFALASSVPLILGLIVLQRSELFFLERFSSDSQIALYSIAFSATAALIAVPSVIGAVLIPSVATLVGSGDFDRIRRGYSRVVRLSLLFALPLTGAALALGPDLLALVYGHRYARAGDVFLIVVVTLPLAPLSGASGALLAGYGRIRAPIVVSSIAAVVDLALAAVLVPRFDAIGAGIANTCAFSIAAALALGYAVKLVGGLQLGLRSVARVGLVSAIAAGLARLVLAASDSPGLFVVAAAVEIAALGLGALALRIVPEEDAAFLASALGLGPALTRALSRLAGPALDA